MLFSLPTWALALVIFGVVVIACVFGAALAQLHIGRAERTQSLVLNVPKAPLQTLQHEPAEPPAAAAP
jgi:hypothetical protein